MSVPTLAGAAHFTVAHFGSQGDADNPTALPPPDAPTRLGSDRDVGMAESKSPEEDALRMLQKQAYTIKHKPENREKNKKSGYEGKGKRSMMFQGEKKKSSLMSPSY